MKRLLLSMMWLMAVLTGMGQNVGDAMYVFTNDNQIKGFIRSEVDSIVYSYEDADGQVYDEVVTQLIYTPDSVYRIPLATVDSVSFETPPIKVNEAVFPLTAQHSAYISEPDTLSFVMASNTPENLRPAVGNIVVATAACMAFENGIVAHVDKIETVEKGYRYVCSQASYDDVFDEINITGKLIDETSNTLRRAAKPEYHHFHLWDEIWSYPFETDNVKAEMKLADIGNATISITKRNEDDPLYFYLRITNAVSGGISINASAEKSFEKEKQLGKTITAGRISVPYTFGLLWFEPKLSAKVYISGNAKAEIDTYASFMHSDAIELEYKDSKWSWNHSSSNSGDIDVAKFVMSGSLEVGIKPQLDFSLNGTQAGFGIQGKVGVCETAEFVYDARSAYNGTLYDAIKDTKISTTLPWSVAVTASDDIFKKYDNERSGKQFKEEYAPEPDKIPVLSERYVVPEFEITKSDRLSIVNGSVWLTSEVSRDCMTDITLGFAILDENKQVVSRHYQGDVYHMIVDEKGTTKWYPEEYSLFANLPEGHAGHPYYSRPLIKVMGMEMLASPLTPVRKVDTMGSTSTSDYMELKGKVINSKHNNYGFFYTTDPSYVNETNSEVVKADVDEDGNMTAIVRAPKYNPQQTYYFRAFAQSGNGLTQYRGDIMTVEAQQPEEGPTRGQMVDLGLSVKWAGWNIGANSAEELGGFCGWGESTVKDDYNSENYEHADKIKDGGTGKLGNLTQAKNELGSNICGTEYDAANRTWGGAWRLPTLEECQELLTQCTKKLITYKERKGLLFTGPNGNSVFMPLKDDGSALYWTGSATIVNYKNQIYGMTLREKGRTANSGPQASTGSNGPASAGMIRAVCK